MNLQLRLKILERFPTQSDFAEAVGESDSLVSRVIRGRRSLPDEKKAVWAAVLDCRPDDLPLN